MALDARTLSYAFDEEAQDFGPPPAPTRPPEEHLGPGERAALALAALGALALALQVCGGAWAGTWGGFGASFGLLALGGSLAPWLARRGTPPGIRHDGLFFRGLTARGALGWVAGVFMTGLYVLIYWFPGALGDHGDGQPTGLVRVVDPLARLVTGYPASRWFLYGVLYTLAVLVFGVRMWMKYRHNRYQQVRTLSVGFFQLAFAWLLPNLLVYLREPYLEFNGLWPLKYDYLWPGKVSELRSAGGLGPFLLTWAALASLVAMPVLTYLYGKRWYCSWVCGCGGLAETLGDPWRQLSSKTDSAWRLERWLIHGVLVAVALATLLLWGHDLSGGRLFGSWAHPFKEWYGFYVGAIFSGVVGVGFYPLLGNRVWCRFGCPQAALLGLLQRLFSRFRITTNGGQCMSCGNCSTYCEMGIDVRAYAQRGANIVRSACVGCGVCAAVCPRGVLRLENGLPGDRFAGADDPWGTFLDALRRREGPGYAAWEGTRTGTETPARQ